VADEDGRGLVWTGEAGAPQSLHSIRSNNSPLSSQRRNHPKPNRHHWNPLLLTPNAASSP
jgi:hypothetical protein